MSFDYVLYDMSWANVRMYNAVIPSYSLKNGSGDKKGDEGRINADDPANKELVRKQLFG